MGPLTITQLRAALPRASASLTAKYYAPITAALTEFGITSPRERRVWFAIMGSETDDLRSLASVYNAREELVSAKGNLHRGDCVRYRPRGAIRISGALDYAMFGNALGVDLSSEPYLAEAPHVAFRIAAYWWRFYAMADHHPLVALLRPGRAGVFDRFVRYGKLIGVTL